MSDWMKFTTFDVIGDLSFGEPLMLEFWEDTSWVKIMFSPLRDIIYLAAMSHLPRPLSNTALKVL